MVVPMMRPDVFGALASHAGDALFECCYVKSSRTSSGSCATSSRAHTTSSSSASPAPSRFDFDEFGPPIEAYGYAAAYSPDPETPGQGAAAVRPRDRAADRRRLGAMARAGPGPDGAAARRRAAGMRRIYLDAGKGDEYFLDLGATAFARELDATRRRVHPRALRRQARRPHLPLPGSDPGAGRRARRLERTGQRSPLSGRNRSRDPTPAVRCASSGPGGWRGEAAVGSSLHRRSNRRRAISDECTMRSRPRAARMPARGHRADHLLRRNRKRRRRPCSGQDAGAGWLHPRACVCPPRQGIRSQGEKSWPSMTRSSVWSEAPALLGDPGAKREVVFGASTGEGLGQLAERAGAPLVVFGSDYRTAPGHSQPGTSAQHLLDGGAVSVAVAVAGLRTRLNEPIKLDRSARRRAQERGRTEDGGRTCGEARCEARGVARRAGGSDRGWLTARRPGRSCRGRRRCARRAGQGSQLGPGSTRWRAAPAVAGTGVG